jgi:hypothetical protein
MSEMTKAKKFFRVRIDFDTPDGKTEPAIVDEYTCHESRDEYGELLGASFLVYTRPQWVRWPLGHYGNNLVLSDARWQSVCYSMMGRVAPNQVVSIRAKVGSHPIIAEKYPQLFGRICSEFGMENPAL